MREQEDLLKIQGRRVISRRPEFCKIVARTVLAVRCYDDYFAIAFSTSSAVRGKPWLSMIEFAILPNGKYIFNADAQLFFRNVNARLQREDHAFVDRQGGIIGVMDIQSHVMSQSVDEIFSQRLAVKVFAVGVDVIKSDLIERIRIGAAGGDFGLPCLKSLHRRFLRREHNVVNLTLAGGELAIDRARCA